MKWEHKEGEKVERMAHMQGVTWVPPLTQERHTCNVSLRLLIGQVLKQPIKSRTGMLYVASLALVIETRGSVHLFGTLYL